MWWRVIMGQVSVDRWQNANRPDLENKSDPLGRKVDGRRKELGDRRHRTVVVKGHAPSFQHPSGDKGVDDVTPQSDPSDA